MTKENQQEVRVSNLDEWLQILGLKQKQFCERVGIDGSTFRRWRSRPMHAGEFNLSVQQAQNLDTLLQEHGLSIHDFPVGSPQKQDA